MSDLRPGLDLRLPQYRREVFLRFYLWTIRTKSSPGGVYFLLPWLSRRYGWTPEQELWFAFLNGNTQHPVTSLVLHRACPDPSGRAGVEGMLRLFADNYGELPFDTDRRHWKTHFPQAVEGYLAAVQRYGGTQARLWSAAVADGWQGSWKAASSLYGFGRLSAFSYLEYLRIYGAAPECTDLMLSDRSGSRSHRNGLCIVSGRDALDWHLSNPGFDGQYSREDIGELEDYAAGLLSEAQQRAAGKTWAPDVGYFTLESALCTYKSWHRPNRRYPGVYLDMLYNRLRSYEAGRFAALTEPFWEARQQCLPAYLRLEDNPTDPGLSPVKQNWYRTTGEVPVLGYDDGVFWSSFDTSVRNGDYGLRRDLAGKRTVLR